MVTIIATGHIGHRNRVTPALLRLENDALAQLKLVRAAYLDEEQAGVTPALEDIR